MYEAIRAVGVEYSGTMARLSDCRVGSYEAVGLVSVPDTAKIMPYQFEPSLVFHPAFLDNCVQILWPLLGAGQGGLDRLYLPGFVKDICIRPNLKIQAGDCFRVSGTTPVESISSERIIESIIVSQPREAAQLPNVSFEGIVMLSLSDVPSIQEKKGRWKFLKVNWEICLDLIRPGQLSACFSLEAAPDDQLQTLKFWNKHLFTTTRLR